MLSQVIKFNVRLLVLVFVLSFTACEQETLTNGENLITEQTQEVTENFLVNDDLVEYNGETYSIEDELIQNLLEKETTSIVVPFPEELSRLPQAGVIPVLFENTEEADNFLKSSDSAVESRGAFNAFDMHVYDKDNFKGVRTVVANMRVWGNPRTYWIPSWFHDRTNSYKLRSDNKNWTINEWPQATVTYSLRDAFGSSLTLRTLPGKRGTRIHHWVHSLRNSLAHNQARSIRINQTRY